MHDENIRQKGFYKVGIDKKQLFNYRGFAKKGLCVPLLFIILLTACSKYTAYPKATVSGDEVTIDALSLKPDVPRFFTYNSGNKNINFFVIKVDNEVLSFLDACLSCQSKLGYTFSDGQFTCKECGTQYSVSEIKNGTGTCSPMRIPGKLRDGKYYIPILELQKSA